MKKLFMLSAVAMTMAFFGCKGTDAGSNAASDKEVTVTIHADQGTQKIYKEIYGQFAEHLGSCIYGGLWVGENSQIPNINGYRKDVFEALKALKVPVLRWPGG